MEIAAKALRSRVGQVLACLDRGESVTITYRGKPRAKLVGIDAAHGEGSSRDTDFPAFGMWRGREDLADVDAHVRELRKGRVDAECIPDITQEHYRP